MSKSEQSDSERATDPYEMWRKLYDANERAWSGALEQAMGTSEFGESSGKLLEGLLAAQKAARDGMRTYLENDQRAHPGRHRAARRARRRARGEDRPDRGSPRLDRECRAREVVGGK